jgi:hypothetical protein
MTGSAMAAHAASQDQRDIELKEECSGLFFHAPAGLDKRLYLSYY